MSIHNFLFRVCHHEVNDFLSTLPRRYPDRDPDRDPDPDPDRDHHPDRDHDHDPDRDPHSKIANVITFAPLAVSP